MTFFFSISFYTRGIRPWHFSRSFLTGTISCYSSLLRRRKDWEVHLFQRMSVWSYFIFFTNDFYFAYSFSIASWSSFLSPIKLEEACSRQLSLSTSLSQISSFSLSQWVISLSISFFCLRVCYLSIFSEFLSKDCSYNRRSYIKLVTLSFYFLSISRYLSYYLRKSYISAMILSAVERCFQLSIIFFLKLLFFCSNQSLKGLLPFYQKYCWVYYTCCRVQSICYFVFFDFYSNFYAAFDFYSRALTSRTFYFSMLRWMFFHKQKCYCSLFDHFFYLLRKCFIFLTQFDILVISYSKLPDYKIEFFFKLCSSAVDLFAMTVNDLMQSVDFVLLGLEDVAGLQILRAQLSELFLELRFCVVVLILHGQDVLVDGDLVF